MVKWALAFVCIWATVLSVSVVTYAHTDNSEGHSRVTADNDTLHYELFIDFFELGRVVDLGVTPGVPQNELKKALQTKQTDVADYLESRLEVFVDGAKSEGHIVNTDVEKYLEREYAHITIDFPTSGRGSKSIQINYSIFFEDNDPMHRNIVNYELGGDKGQFIFNAGTREFHVGNGTILGQISRFVQLGFHHILIGYDHILFVIALVLGSRKIGDVLKVITVFTLAHSLTLGFTALKLVDIPAKIVEPLIALSIAFVAVESLFSQNSKYRLWAVFGFGLIHGIGFAGALKLTGDITMKSLLSILSFNVGVEAGQALIILLLFPILLLIRRFRWSGMVQGVATTGIAVFGLVWYFQRFLS
jgi:hydrogenase/urease accessory protein HupE